ncbi:MAG: hypothetical protein IFK94_09725 [Acidobacteria bacterium]|uniref:DUF5666 domain-containing protein n=1 Tax=Candidatus Polarisedimenticola svalbardensis TaxID=2886004 RepID=A0A8J6XXD7_9BACT|nr:hypothetical protein [Candidatus Polarisedimenticola svalbardensis]
MKKQLMIAAVLLLVFSLAPAMAQEGEPTEVKGEVIQVQLQQRLQTGNQGEFDHLMIQTREGVQMRVRLGEGGSCEGMVAEGDQVRLRLMAGGPVDGAYQARTMKVRRTGESYQFRNEAGDMVQIRAQTRAQDGTGDGVQVRTRSQTRHQSGSSSGRGSSGGGQGGGRQGGGGR